jgi:hypothetical protein
VNEKPRRKPPNRGKAGGRTEITTERWTKGELARVNQKAADAGLARGSYIRAAALGDAGPRARRSPTVEKELLGAAIAAMNKVGSNLNQIARAINTGKDYDDAYLRDCVGKMQSILTAYLAAINR